ncbi:low molecular weight protein-tyrosine-phosphatase [Filimonas effusa]|nr:low molecular weight protein-tyrosine-phosphatase [Filimonas effusa]
MKILMVCLGNICRSPLAEGILRHKIKQHKLNWEVASAGTGGYHTGEAPHKLSQKVALYNGIDISGQCARQFEASDMLSYDYIYVMDASNYQDVKRMSGRSWDPSKTDLLLNELYPGQHRGVPDPWYGGEEGYHEVFELIDKACDNIILKFKA